MKQDDIYRSGYKFAVDRDKRYNRNLILIVGFLIFLILASLCYGSISSLNFFAKKSEQTTQVYQEPTIAPLQDTSIERISRDFKSVNIPYEDPKGRFSIVYMGIFPTEDIGVVIRSRKDYDVIKSEAEKIIDTAREKVKINSVTYINRFEK